MLFSHLDKITSGELLLDHDAEITHFSVDSRTMTRRPGEVFIAIHGDGDRDGHDFIENAVNKGVRNFIVSRQIDVEEANVFIVKDTKAAFQHIAREHRSKFEIPIVGITGSNGKTTVKEWLSTLLSEKYHVVKSPKSYNSQIGVPISLLEIGEGHEVGVFEAGISRMDEMEKLEGMIKPTLGIFTNLGEAHDDGFDSLSQKLSQKLKLFCDSEKVICRNDQAYSRDLQEALDNKAVTWGDRNAHYQVKWSEGTIQVNDHSFQSHFESKTQLENLTHSMIAALEMGLSHDQIQKGVDLVHARSRLSQLSRRQTFQSHHCPACCRHCCRG